MILSQAREHVIDRLKQAGLSEPLVESDLLLCKVLGCDRSWLIAHKERPIFDYELQYLNALLERRCNKEPLAYIFNEAQFYGRNFYVGEGVLVPRPETESLVEIALSLVDKGIVVDWGTGSGCIVISLLLENPKLRGIALDVNPKALYWAWKNIDKYDLFDRLILWHESGKLPAQFAKSGVDAIVSNPPYIPTNLVDTLMSEVKCFEPISALDGGNDGTLWYRFLFERASLWLKEGGWLIVETGGWKEKEILSLAPTRFSLCEIKKLNGGVCVIAWRLSGKKSF